MELLRGELKHRVARARRVWALLPAQSLQFGPRPRRLAGSLQRDGKIPRNVPAELGTLDVLASARLLSHAAGAPVHRLRSRRKSVCGWSCSRIRTSENSRRCRAWSATLSLSIDAMSSGARARVA